MSDPETILHELRAAGITVTHSDGQLRLEYPPCSYSDAMVERVRRNKTAILQTLRGRPRSRTATRNAHYAPWELERMKTVPPSLLAAVSTFKEVFADAGGVTVVRVESDVAFQRRRMAKLLRKARAMGCIQLPHAPFRPTDNGRSIARRMRAIIRDYVKDTPKGADHGKLLKEAIRDAEHALEQSLFKRA